MTRWALLVLLVSACKTFGQDSPCADYAVNDCAQDIGAEIISFNTGSQLKCQQHCELFSECQFYSFHKNPTQNVDCHLFSEPFNVYLNHCSVRMGPLNQSPPAECISPEENSCEVQQSENCNLWGRVTESDLYAPDVLTCETLCKLNQEQCEYWQWFREKGTCNLLDSAEKECNIVFGPREGAPGECGTTEKPPDTTTGSTASPGVCGIECPPDGLQLFPDCENCNQFYECYNSVLTTKICENCYHFDKENEYCNEPSQVDCDTRPPEEGCTTTTTSTTTATPATTTKPGDCPNDKGYFRDKHNCGRYFDCVDGVATSHSCSSFSCHTCLYDDKLEWCTFPNNVDCEERPICAGEPPEYNNCQCQGAETVPDFSCPPSGHAVFLDPFNCQHIMACKEGEVIQDTYCEDGMYADEQTLTCVAGDASLCAGRPLCHDKTGSEDCYCI